MVATSPDDHRQLLQHQRYADRGDQRRQARRAAQRPVGDAFDAEPEHHAGQRRHRKANHHHHGSGQHADQGFGDCHCHHCADHHHIAMREVDETENAVHHGVAESDQGVDAAEREAVEYLLDEGIHQCGLKVSCSTTKLARTQPDLNYVL